MTNEEAVNVLRNTCLIAGRVNGKTVFAEALNMAIMALETQPEETCDTCIHSLFRDSRCEECRVGRMSYPSYYERRTDEQINKS